MPGLPPALQYGPRCPAPAPVSGKALASTGMAAVRAPLFSRAAGAQPPAELGTQFQPGLQQSSGTLVSRMNCTSSRCNSPASSACVPITFLTWSGSEFRLYNSDRPPWGL